MAFSARTLLRHIGRGALIVLALVLIAAVGVAFAGGQRLARTADAHAHPVTLPRDSGALSEGRRLASFWGCTGCHGEDAGGGVMFESPLGDRFVAPNLTHLLRESTAAEVERAVRHGVGRDGESLVVMPSSMFVHMSDQDFGKVMAYLRSLPAVPDTMPPLRFGLLARYFVLTGEDMLEIDRIPPDAVHGPSPDSLGPGATRADTLALGRYLARTGCPECHGVDLQGGLDAPDLRIAAAYTPENFERLIEEGVGLGGRDLGLMSLIARGRIAQLTLDERAALHAYLRTLAE